MKGKVFCGLTAAALLMLGSAVSASGATKPKRTPAKVISAPITQIERDKAAVEILADKYMKSITNVCDGHLVYYDLGRHGQTYYKNDGTEYHNDFDIYELNTKSWAMSLNYIPAKKQTEVDILNKIIYYSSIEVKFYHYNSNNKAAPLIYRSRSGQGEWGQWREGTFWGNGTYYPLQTMIFSNKSGNTFELSDLKILRIIFPTNSPESGQKTIDSYYIEKINNFLKNKELSRPSCSQHLEKIDDSSDPIEWLHDENFSKVLSDNGSGAKVEIKNDNQNNWNVNSSLASFVKSKDDPEIVAQNLRRQEKYTRFRDTFGAAFGDTSYSLKSGKWVKGVSVYRITTNSPAEKLGLMSRDQIIKFGGVRVTDAEELNAVLATLDLQNLGKEVQVIRNQEIIKLNKPR